MKPTFRIHFVVIVSLFSIITFGCEEDELQKPRQEDIELQFALAQRTFAEDTSSQSITISLAKAAEQEGIISIEVDHAGSERFITVPEVVHDLISLPVRKGASTVTFNVIPIDNTTVNDPVVITFSIKSISQGFKTGSQKTFTVTITDNESPAPLAKSQANFIAVDATMTELNTSGLELRIHLSEPLAEAGELVIGYQSNNVVYGTHFTTEPAMDDGKLFLSPAIGSRVTNFKVFPVDNTIITGELEILFAIETTSGGIIKGSNLTERFRIADDELTGKPKGYEISAGSWSLKETYEYNQSGFIDRVHIERATPATSNHTEVYIYDAQGKIERIQEYENIHTLYTWENNKIIKSEVVKFGIIKQYSLYDYDQRGNVSGQVIYYRQPDGSYALGMTIVYLYYEDGNIYKQMNYMPLEGSEEGALVSTRTYEGYILAENPFPMVTILPTVKTQQQLPTSYRIEEGGADILYHLNYEFRMDGKVGKRRATSSKTSETAIYHYY